MLLQAFFVHLRSLLLSAHQLRLHPATLKSHPLTPKKTTNAFCFRLGNASDSWCERYCSKTGAGHKVTLTFFFFFLSFFVLCPKNAHMLCLNLTLNLTLCLSTFCTLNESKHVCKTTAAYAVLYQYLYSFCTLLCIDSTAVQHRKTPFIVLRA